MSEHPTHPEIVIVEPVDVPVEASVTVIAVAIIPERVVVTGGPLSASTGIALDFASSRGLAVRDTDETMTLPWSEASARVAEWFDAPGPWIVHGVAAPRALRKWLAAHPEGKPCDAVLFAGRPLAELTKGQETMRKGIATVWAEILPELQRRGVEVEVRA